MLVVTGAATVAVAVFALVVTSAAFSTPRSTVPAVFEFSLDPPQAASAIAATASSTNLLDRMLIELNWRS